MKRLMGLALLVAITSGEQLLAQNTPAQARASAPAPLARQVRTALGHGCVDDARLAVQRSRETGPKRIVATALIAIYEGKDDDAKSTLWPLSTGDAADEDAVLELGLIEMRHGRKDAATELLTRVVQSAKDMDTDGFLLMARAAAAMGDVTVANSIYQRVGPSESDRADVHALWGDLWMQTHSRAEAARSYQDALKADVNWVPALIGNSRALSADEPAAAAEMMAKVQQVAPKSPDVWLLVAEHQVAVQDFTGARASIYAGGTVRDVDPILGEARALNPASTQVLLAVAGQAAQLYRLDDAVAFARQAAKADDDVAGPHADLGSYLLRTGDEAEARVELEKAFKNSGPNRSGIVTGGVDGAGAPPSKGAGL